MVRELSNEKKQAFLDAALRLFAAGGVQNTSTAEIAKEAGTAAGTLFLYFPSKQDLVDAVAVMICQEESEAINNLLDPALPVRDSLFAIWDGSIRWLMAHPDAFRFSMQTREPGVVTQSAALETARYFAFFYTTIQRGLDEGSLKPYPIDLIGGYLYQDIVAVINHLQAQPVGGLEKAIQQGFELFWDGIKVK
jgi:AcrR family transcriptional regulator